MKIVATEGFFGKVGTELMIRPIIDNTEATTCSTYWELKTDNGDILANGNIVLTEEEYTEWGSENTYLENLLLSKLGLDRYREDVTE